MSGDQRDVRRNYGRTELHQHELNRDPIAQFSGWLQVALDGELIDATAMTLATADERGRPSARIVLLKQFDDAGFVWYTDYESQKGQELAVNPQATLLFYWRELERQVRISGEVTRLPYADSEAYFLSRPSDSRYSAAASAQSAPVDSRADLEAKVRELEVLFPDDNVPMPQSWGGYVLAPNEFEFWQGRVGRLHDRFRYFRRGQEWGTERLQP